MLKRSLQVVIFLMVLAAPILAHIIDVPADFPTIQGGIDASLNGDTVLVQPGTYMENINFNGHSIILGSLFLTTRDISYISSTIIDGDSSGSVVSFYNGEDSTAAIVGFTVQNGFHFYGGGIYCSNSSPTISHNIIRWNTVYDFEIQFLGGGIFCGYSNASILNNMILDNKAYGGYGGFGGAIYCFGSNVTLRDNLIAGNQSNAGGGIYGWFSAASVDGNIIAMNSATYGGGLNWKGGLSPTLTNNTFSRNVAWKGGAAAFMDTCSPQIITTVFWADSASFDREIYRDDDSWVAPRYCDIEGTLWPGEGNINVDPLFCYPDTLNFYLAENSPCRGAGPYGENIGALDVGCGAAPCQYVLGDANGSGVAQGIDVTFMVNFLRGAGEAPPTACDCPPHGVLYTAADANGDCVFNGLDIVYLVNYFKGFGSAPAGCPDCPPGSPAFRHHDIRGDCLGGMSAVQDSGYMVLEVIGNDLHIHHMEAIYQCCLEYFVEYQIAGVDITAIEHDTGPPCDCICRFNLESILYDLQVGSYSIRLIGIYGDTVGVDTISIGDSR